MKVLVIGGGGREHALAWRLAASPRVSEVLVAPGNAGTARERRVRNCPVDATDLDSLVALAQREAIDLTVVGPEAPLVAGVVDAFAAAGRVVFGPTRDAARLEGSKAWAKAFMRRHGIPTARHASFSDPAAALAYLDDHPLPVVIKADGLAAGKGVVIAETLAAARAAVTEMLTDRSFGSAGATIVVEEFLAGEEASYIVMTDGETMRPMASAQDHKRAYDGDTGPNTGGMGAYSPAPVVTSAVAARIDAEVIAPALAGFRAEGMRYRGFLYAGLMIAPDGSVRVLEFNCRFGDPECQAILVRLESDFAEACLKAATDRLHEVTLAWDSRPAVGVVATSAGYPGAYETGAPIRGIATADGPDVKVFEAGTALEEGAPVTAGGRVLCVTGRGADVNAACARAYEALARISFHGMYYRRDIAHRALARAR